MRVKRGDVVLAWYPFSSGAGGKRRPCVIVQNDEDNDLISNTVIVQIITNLGEFGDKSHFPISIASPDGQKAGLLFDSMVSCNNLATIEINLIDRVIGSLSPTRLGELNQCLKNALAIS